MSVCGFLGVYVYQWVSIGVYGFLWVSRCLWAFTCLYGCLWVFMSVNGCHGFLWVFPRFWVYGYLWVSIGSHVGIDHRPSIGRMPNLSGRSLAIVPGPDIKMWRAGDAGYLTMGQLWNPSFNWWQIDNGPDKNLRPAEYWPKVYWLSAC